MAAQPDHDSQAPPIYHPDQAMLHLLRASYPDYSPQHPVPPSLSSQPSPNAQKHTPPNTHSDITSTHRSPVGFAPPPNQDHSRRPAREVVPGLPRTQTLKRQQSERREHLTPVEMPPEERRAASSDIKSPFSILTGRDHASFATPSAFDSAFDAYSDLAFSATSSPRLLEDEELQNSEDDEEPPRKAPMHVPPPTLQPGVTLIPGTNLPDTTNMPREKFDALIESELENVWILNLSMHFRDRSRREKFFLTYRERETIWRRVTISIDYRDAPPDSLEGELAEMKLQRDKSAKMYEALRDSLPDIHFYDTATNLTLKTSEGRLHVHVVEDANEKIDYPRVETLKHLNCLMVKECDIVFDSHMSGFVYKIRVGDQVMVKKEVPGAETVEEFLYEIHALHSLQDSDHVIRFRGLVTDNDDEIVKALLLDYCPGGSLIDKIYDDCKTTYLGIPWRKRERWARQVIHGVADLHESGFVQGDLTLANVVLDDKENARIIDVNRRGCPVGWEPPEAKPLVDTNQRLSLYIGVKSDLFQLGMLLWALAMEEDEPEIQGRPLLLGPEVNIPDWYRQITEICLSHDPRSRLMASQLLTMIPDQSFTPAYSRITSRPAVDHRHSPRELSGENALNAAPTSEIKNEQLTFPQRGRSPPSPMPSDSSRQRQTGWAANIPVAASYDDMAAKAKRYQEASRNRNSMPTPDSESRTQQQQPQPQQRKSSQHPSPRQQSSQHQPPPPPPQPQQPQPQQPQPQQHQPSPQQKQQFKPPQPQSQHPPPPPPQQQQHPPQQQHPQQQYPAQQHPRQQQQYPAQQHPQHPQQQPQVQPHQPQLQNQQHQHQLLYQPQPEQPPQQQQQSEPEQPQLVSLQPQQHQHQQHQPQQHQPQQNQPCHWQMQHEPQPEQHEPQYQHQPEKHQLQYQQHQTQHQPQQRQPQYQPVSIPPPQLQHHYHHQYQQYEDQQPMNLAPARSQERERSFLGDASKDSTTPPVSFAAMLPPKQPSPSKRLSPPKQPTPSTQTSTYFDTVNSDISMWSPSEETVAYPSSTSPPHDLVTKIHDELLEDLERNGAARSALQAIFGRSNDNYAPVAQNTAQLRNDSTVSKYPTQRADEATNIPQSPPRPDNTSSTDQITTQLDKSASEISQTTTRRADDGFNPPATAQLENTSNSRPFISKLVKKDYTSLQTNAPLEKGLADYPTTAKKDSDASTVCQFTTQWPDDAVTIPQTTPQQIDHASYAPETTTQRGNNVATIRNSSAEWTDDAALDPQMNPKRIGIPAQRDESVSMNTKTTTRQAENASNVPQSNRQRDDSASIKDQSSFQREHNATVTLQTTAEREQSIKMIPQIASQWEQNTTIASQTATQLENSSTMPQTTDQLDDNASVASYMSRTSSPDGDLEGGAQLSRSDTAFSVVNTHFQRPEYTTISRVPLETIIDTPLTAFDQHSMDKPNGTLPNLGPGQGIAAPLHTDLKTDIRFDSSLWPDTTRRFMTDTKS
ncbi:hypothetical protein MY3296_002977 [Beauveria thailandica]